MGNGDGDAALGGPVELGDDDSVQVEGVVELLRLRQAVLPGRGVDDEDDRDGRGGAAAGDAHDLRELAHKLGRAVQAPGRVHEHELGPLPLGTLDHVVADACRVGAALARHDLGARALAPDL